MNLKETLIIAGFPGVGKTYFMKNNLLGLSALDIDLDYIKYNKDDNGDIIERENYLEEYMNYIKDHINKVDMIFISLDNEVREYLKDNNIDYTLIYPDYTLKEPFIKRNESKGLDYIMNLRFTFDDIINNIEQDNFPTKFKLVQELSMNMIIRRLLDRIDILNQ